MIAIEKGVAVPSGARWRNRYPWADMVVGDSFVFPPGIARTSASNIARGAGARYGRVFKIHAMDGGGYRCWRIE
jgi:hypothetical protein